MTPQEIEHQVKHEIEEQLGEYVEVNSNTNLSHDLLLDSLDKVELLMRVERTFGISIPDSECHSVKTVGDIITCVTKRLPVS